MFSDYVGLHIVKALYIFFIGNVYLFFGSLASHTLSVTVAKDYDPKKSKIRNLLQLILETGLIMISVYLIRILITHHVPHPFGGIFGFQAERVKELSGGVVLAFAFLMYMKEPITSKVQALYRII